MTGAYEEAVAFLAGGMTPQELVAYKPSSAASDRFEWLVHKEKTDGLLPEERDELDRTMEIERVLSLAKAKARLSLSLR